MVVFQVELFMLLLNTLAGWMVSRQAHYMSKRGSRKYLAVSLNTLSIGTMPLEVPLVPRM